MWERNDAKMEDLKIENLYNIEQTIAQKYLNGDDYPWVYLSQIKSLICKIGETLDNSIYEKKGENIWIAKSAKIEDFVTIKGPVIIDEYAEIRHCAYIRGSVIVGKNCVVGNSTEVKNSILFNEVKIPHFNYVGDSILGYKSHMGAGSITSNLKTDQTNICIIMKDGKKVETHLRKVGAIIGDYAQVGCNTVLNPGTILGRNSNIYSGCSVRGIIPSNYIYKDKNNIVEKVKRF